MQVWLVSKHSVIAILIDLSVMQEARRLTRKHPHEHDAYVLGNKHISISRCFEYDSEQINNGIIWKGIKHSYMPWKHAMCVILQNFKQIKYNFHCKAP